MVWKEGERVSDELPQWILDALTDIKMAASDLNMSDAEFIELTPCMFYGTGETVAARGQQTRSKAQFGRHIQESPENRVLFQRDA